MAAFKENLVVSVIHKNKPIREINDYGKRVAKIPFGSEYSIRLKNKTSGRVLVEVTVDGMDVNSDGSKFLINPYQNLDVERFVDSLTSGKKFKFISLEEGASTGEIQDPTSRENGLVKVVFWKEKIIKARSKWPGVNDYSFVDCNQPSSFNNGNTKGIFRASSVGGSLGGCPDNGDSTLVTNCDGVTFTCTDALIGSAAPDCCINEEIAPSSAGATVEGGESNQQFINVDTDFETESTPVTIEIWLKGAAHAIDSPWKVVMNGGLPKDVFYEGKRLSNCDFSLSKDGLVLCAKHFKLG